MWTHEVHNHGHGDFCRGSSSTRYIEQYWFQLKMNLKKIYPIFPEFEYIYYIKEGEFRTYLSKKSDNDKTIAILKMLKKDMIIAHMIFLLKKK